jgi:hypothetical protein
MVVVFHDAKSVGTNEESMRQNFVEYGRRIENLVGEIRRPNAGLASRDK